MSKIKTLNIFVITKTTLKFIVANWKKLFLLTLIVTLPASLFRAVQLDSTTDASLVATFAGFFLTLTLYWCFAENFKLSKTKIVKAYVLASSRILPFILATIIISLFTLPIIFGVLIFVLAFSAQISLWFGVVGLAMIFFGLYILVKSSFITTIAAVETSSAFTALQLSWAITKGNFWKVLFSWIYLFTVLVVLSGIILTPVLRINVVSQNDYLQAIISGLLLIIFLPFTIGYITNLYKNSL